jgi:hypothetical protein
MQFKFFVIPFKSNDDATEEMNRFLRGHRLFPGKGHLDLNE